MWYSIRIDKYRLKFFFQIQYFVLINTAFPGSLPALNFTVIIRTAIETFQNDTHFQNVFINLLIDNEFAFFLQIFGQSLGSDILKFLASLYFIYKICHVILSSLNIVPLTCWNEIFFLKLLLQRSDVIILS